MESEFGMSSLDSSFCGGELWRSELISVNQEWRWICHAKDEVPRGRTGLLFAVCVQ